MAEAKPRRDSDPPNRFRARGALLSQSRNVEASRRSGGRDLPVVGRRPSIDGSASELEHGLLRSSANPGQVFDMRRPVAGAQCSRLSWLRRSRSARLRRYCGGRILCCSFGELPSVEPRAAQSSACQGAGAASMKIHAGRSNFAFERTVTDKVPIQCVRRAAAQRAR